MTWAADAYLLKSTDLTELKEKIRELLEKRSPISGDGGVSTGKKAEGKMSANSRR
jgi:DNA-binding response OmpR family regulator